MRSKIKSALIVSLSAISLVLATSETFAASRSARGAFASAHRPGTHFSHHDRRARSGLGWFGDDGAYYGPNGEELTPPAAGGPLYSDTNDFPWDWAHRYPPIVTPSERAYIPSCPTAVVTVPGHDGTRQTVNVTQCF